MWLNRFGITGNPSGGSVMYFVEFNPDDPGGASMGESVVGFVGASYPGAITYDGLYIGQDSDSIGFMAGTSTEGSLRRGSSVIYQGTDIYWNGGSTLGLGIVFDTNTRTHVYFFLDGVNKYDFILEDYVNPGPYKIAASIDQDSALNLNIKLIPSASDWVFTPTLPIGINTIGSIRNLTSFLDENSGTVTESGTKILKGTVATNTPYVTNTIIIP